MKTTIEIGNELLTRSRQLANSRGITLRALVEEGLQRALAAHEETPLPQFVLHTFGHGGLTAEAEAKGTHRMILETYEEQPRWSAPRTDVVSGVHDRDRG
jgi:hypothetical protein